MGLAGAVLGAGALTAVGGVVSSSLGSSAQQNAANTAANTQLSMYNQTRNDLMPFTQAGQSSIGSLQNLLGNGGVANTDAMMNALQNYPGYQFALQQGNLGLDRSAAAKGTLYSGGQLKDLSSYNQGLASQLFGNYFNQNLSLAQLGENAGANTGSQGTLAASGAAQSQLAGGNAAAAGYAGINNALTGQNGLTSSALQAYILQNGSGGITPTIGNSLTPDEASTLNGLSSGYYLPSSATSLGF